MAPVHSVSVSANGVARSAFALSRALRPSERIPLFARSMQVKEVSMRGNAEARAVVAASECLPTEWVALSYRSYS